MIQGTFAAKVPLVLASASPRRREMLSRLGLEFVLAPAPDDEPAPDFGELPAAYALRMARKKALAVAGSFPEALVIGADTVVALGSLILGKPGDPAHARRMLARLSGRVHIVVTGCCLASPSRDPAGFTVTSEVTLTPLSEEVIAAYVATGEPLDKAGAYAIQGRAAFMVERISGSVSNVIGLPLAELTAALTRLGAIAVRQDGQ